MMKNRKILIGILSFVMMAALCGCSLAKEDAGEEITENSENQDRLIGVYITEESLDLFDMEAYLEDHAEELLSGKDVAEENSSKYNGRIYAAIDKKGSSDPGEWEICFEGTEGVNFFDAEFQMEGSESFTMLCGDGVCDVWVANNVTDTGMETELTGNIYVLPAEGEAVVYYANPVYQTIDGDIYVTSGTGSSFGSASEGVEMTQTLEGERTVTENGETRTDKTTINITYVFSYEPLRILVHQMDADNQVIKTETYAPGTLPEQIVAEKETAYILVETQWNHPEKETYSTREIYERSDIEEDYFETMVLVEDGRLEKQSTHIIWGD